jgi:hypothetical protein
MDFWATEYTKLAMDMVQPGRTSVPGALGAGAFGGAAGAGGLMAANHALGQPAMSQGLADSIYGAPGQIAGAAHNGIQSFRSMLHSPLAPDELHNNVGSMTTVAPDELMNNVGESTQLPPDELMHNVGESTQLPPDELLRNLTDLAG